MFGSSSTTSSFAQGRWLSPAVLAPAEPPALRVLAGGIAPAPAGLAREDDPPEPAALALLARGPAPAEPPALAVLISLLSAICLKVA